MDKFMLYLICGQILWLLVDIRTGGKAIGFGYSNKAVAYITALIWWVIWLPAICIAAIATALELDKEKR